MLHFVLGMVAGWFTHIHYGTQITEAIARLSGGA